MNIGIDIDNTLTDIEKKIFDAANKYTKQINPDFKEIKEKKFDGQTNAYEFYTSLFGWDLESAKYFFSNQRIDIVDNVKPRARAKEILQKLKDEGNNIYIVTARTTRFDSISPYERAKQWLDRNGITYDYLLIDAKDKAAICKKYNITIFVDDQLNNCLDLSRNGIYTIRFSNSSIEYPNIVNSSNFDDVYAKINEYIRRNVI